MGYATGHLIRNYLALTQTFIYQILQQARSFKPFVLTDIAQNLNIFPTDCTYLIKQKELHSLKQELGSKRQKRMAQQLFSELNYPNCFEQFIKDQNLNILHAHFGPTGFDALKLKKRSGLPLITSFHGYDASAMLRMPRWKRNFKRLFREGDLFLVVGQNMAQRLNDAGCPEKKMRVQHVGIDLQQTIFTQREMPKSGNVTLLYCGRLVEKKGITDVLDAFIRLANKWPKLSLRIVGDGPLRKAVKQKIQHHKLKKRVTLCGALQHHKTLQEMHRAHLFVLPSATAPNGDMEGAPVVLMEAQAMGLPVVSTHHADISEVICDTQSGYLVSEHDIDALTDRLDHLLNHSELWPLMGQIGHKHIKQNYNIHKEIENLEKIYKTLS